MKTTFAQTKPVRVSGCWCLLHLIGCVGVIFCAGLFHDQGVIHETFQNFVSRCILTACLAAFGQSTGSNTGGAAKSGTTPAGTASSGGGGTGGGTIKPGNQSSGSTGSVSSLATGNGSQSKAGGTNK